MNLQWASPALKELAHLPPAIKKRIVNKMEWFAEQKEPLAFAKPLKGKRFGSHRFRIGDYRVLVEVHGSTIQIILILAVRHRKEAYDL